MHFYLTHLSKNYFPVQLNQYEHSSGICKPCEILLEAADNATRQRHSGNDCRDRPLLFRSKDNDHTCKWVFVVGNKQNGCCLTHQMPCLAPECRKRHRAKLKYEGIFEFIVTDSLIG